MIGCCKSTLFHWKIALDLCIFQADLYGIYHVQDISGQSGVKTKNLQVS